MTLTPEEKEKTESATMELSDLLVSIYEDELPTERIPTDVDLEFKEKLFDLRKINPLLADGFVLMYNHIQDKKIKSGDTYTKILRKKTIFENYADQIWHHGYFAEDEKRWHSSGYHIDEGQLSIDDAIGDAHEVLDMIAAMTKEIYSQVKEYGRYAFKEEPDWNIKAKEYIDDLFGDF